MNLWQVSTTDSHIAFGPYRRKKLYPSGCNEPFKGRFWCPGRGWFLKGPCPFVNKQECGNFRRMCGAI